MLLQLIVLIKVTVDGEEIKTTETHPWYVEGKGFINAEYIEAGDKVRTDSGEVKVVENVEKEKLPIKIVVINLTVKDNRTYFVGENEILVHNTCSENPYIIETSYVKSSKNFEKINGGMTTEDFITPHSEKHIYNPKQVSTKKKTQFGKDIDVAKLREDTMLHPDEIIYKDDQNMIIYKKEYGFNISTPDTPTGSHRVYINLDPKAGKTNRNSQFPFYKGNN